MLTEIKKGINGMADDYSDNYTGTDKQNQQHRARVGSDEELSSG